MLMIFTDANRCPTSLYRSTSKARELPASRACSGLLLFDRVN
ncbi:hypothetical protein SpAn4DRAFT_5186 [Sporomusa ovata]|uniref:Uncharacterized protein n=1 Tax=Sporomusa ovata TaxID=2378 RepID=A0A0U1L1V9_9FIRM|nr:hypothetical protein SpAn4DRAFT_5186 [Sporomusa ovata]